VPSGRLARTSRVFGSDEGRGEGCTPTEEKASSLVTKNGTVLGRANGRPGEELGEGSPKSDGIGIGNGKALEEKPAKGIIQDRRNQDDNSRSLSCHIGGKNLQSVSLPTWRAFLNHSKPEEPLLISEPLFRKREVLNPGRERPLLSLIRNGLSVQVTREIFILCAVRNANVFRGDSR